MCSSLRFVMTLTEKLYNICHTFHFSGSLLSCNTPLACISYLCECGHVPLQCEAFLHNVALASISQQQNRTQIAMGNLE